MINGQIEISVRDKKDGVVLYISFKKKRGRKLGSGAPRKTWDDYGITIERYRELRHFCETTDDVCMLNDLCSRAGEFIAPYIFESVRHHKTYEFVEYMNDSTIPCGRTDFYGYRRKFYHLLDEKLKGCDENGD